jgi:acyl-CoA reductase-like NAD-dependent aldehyde dehydrogenase
VSTATQRFLDREPANYIAGSWQATTGGTLPVINPATEEVIGQIPASTASDVDAAVQAAQAALEDPAWRDMAPHDRTALLLRIADVLEANVDEIAELDSLDTGMPLMFARAFVAEAAKTFRYFAGWVTKIYGETNPSGPDLVSFTTREPIGVCAHIIAWNGPVGTSAWKLAPALACGNTSVLKPAEQASLTPLRLGELLTEAGVPAGVVNVVSGTGQAVGDPLVRHPGVDKVSFTGSTATGRAIAKAAAENYTRVTLETGGKSPNIVFPDADLDSAVAAAVQGFCLLSGQVCSAGTRVFVHADIYDDFVERLAQASQSMTVGDPWQPTTMMGPLVSKEQYERVLGYVRDGVSAGATLRTGGQERDGAGYFVEPTIFTGVDNGMRIAQEEIFGPVVVVIRFTDEDEVVGLANDVDFGLAAAVWTRDLSRAHRVSRRLKAGTVWVNTYGMIDPIAPWGGYKASGIGRELGRYAIDAFTQTKSVYMQL